eukprot:m51a1_g12187 hypothetical protein (396) ;mRNA; f:9808-11254
MALRSVLVVLAAAAVASASYSCYNNPNRGSDNVIPYSVGAGTVTTTVQRAGGNLGVDWRSVQCYLYFSYVASDAQGRPLTTTWEAPRTERMTRSTAHGGNMWTGTLPLRNESVLEVVSYCVAEGQQLWCGGVEGNIIFRMPPVHHQTRSAHSDLQVFTTPAPGSDNVVSASVGVATLTTTVNGASVDLSRVQCFAWFGYVRATDDGRILSTQWGPAVSMQQTRVLAEGGNTFVAEIPLKTGRVLQATSYCVADGELRWATMGNVNFRLPASEQHPTGSLSIVRPLSTPLGLSTVAASSSVYPLNVVARFNDLSGYVPLPEGARCVAHFGYPVRFGSAWPTVNETQLMPMGSHSGSDFWYGLLPLPAAGKLLEASARCTYNGVEAWIGGNIQVQAI